MFNDAIWDPDSFYPSALTCFEASIIVSGTIVGVQEISVEWKNQCFNLHPEAYYLMTIRLT